MKKIICIAGCIFTTFLAIGQTTYYSRNAGSGGDWDLAASWTLSSDGTGVAAGPPTRTDNTVILNGHTITVDADDDNGSPGTSASTQFTVGAFSGNGTERFYQNGIVTIDAGGTLSITDNTGAMFEGTLDISGTLTISAGGNRDDLVIAGDMFVRTGSTLSVGDDLILIDDSETVMDNVGISSDDIYMDGINALICGDGSLDIGGAIQEFNGADANAQVCDTFAVNCSDNDCCDDGTTVSSCTGNGDDGSFGGGGGFVLPVELISFNLSKESNSVLIEWATASELNNRHFTIEKSFNGSDFSHVTKVEGNGTTSEMSRYQFLDRNISPNSTFYRLLQTDFDGSTEMLGIKHIIPELRLADNVFYPNPATDFVQVSIAIPMISSMEIMDLSGKILLNPNVNQLDKLDVSGLKKGIYMIKWIDTYNNQHLQRLIID